MRPRFSLRWLLIAFAIFSVCLYVLFIRPTVLAERFVAAINRGEADPYDVVQRPQLAASRPTDNKTVVARVLPRTWSDILHARRELGATITWFNDKSRFSRQHYVEIQSALTGFRLIRWQEMFVPRDDSTPGSESTSP
jgi:hypothetical protein